jgi:hypothetical protein
LKGVFFGLWGDDEGAHRRFYSASQAALRFSRRPRSSLTGDAFATIKLWNTPLHFLVDGPFILGT